MEALAEEEALEVKEEEVTLEDGAAEEEALEEDGAAEEEVVGAAEEEVVGAAEEEVVGAAEEEVVGAAEEDGAAEEEASPRSLANLPANLSEYHGSLVKNGTIPSKSMSLYKVV